jgi:hypothetical protein
MFTKMTRGGGNPGAPQLSASDFGLGQLVPDVSHAAAPMAGEIFKEAPAKPKTIARQLMDAPVGEERARLLSAWFIFVERVDAFLAQERRQRIRENVRTAIIGVLGENSNTDSASARQILQAALDQIDKNDGATTKSKHAAELATEDLTLQLGQFHGNDEARGLLSEGAILIGTAHEFLDRQASFRRSTVEKRRAEVYASCRELEDRLKREAADLGIMRGSHTVLAGKLSQARAAAKAAEEDRPQTKFPTAVELESYGLRVSAALTECGAVDADVRQLDNFIASAEAQVRQTRHEFQQKVEELAVIDRELGAKR